MYNTQQLLLHVMTVESLRYSHFILCLHSIPVFLVELVVNQYFLCSCALEPVNLSIV